MQEGGSSGFPGGGNGGGQRVAVDAVVGALTGDEPPVVLDDRANLLEVRVVVGVGDGN